MTHAFFKALPLPRRRQRDPRPAPASRTSARWAGCCKKIPITGWTFLVGLAGDRGIFPFAGFFTKDEILWKAFAAATRCSLAAEAALGCSASSRPPDRLLHDPPRRPDFFGKSRAGDEVEHHVHESPRVDDDPADRPAPARSRRLRRRSRTCRVRGRRHRSRPRLAGAGPAAPAHAGDAGHAVAAREWRLTAPSLLARRGRRPMLVGLARLRAAARRCPERVARAPAAALPAGRRQVLRRRALRRGRRPAARPRVPRRCSGRRRRADRSTALVNARRRACAAGGHVVGCVQTGHVQAYAAGRSSLGVVARCSLAGGAEEVDG